MIENFDLKFNFLVHSGVEFLALENLSDFKATVSLDKESFPFPWPEEEWFYFFKSRCLSTYIVLIKDSFTSKLVGFCLWDMNNVDSFAHLLKILISPSLRVQGFGETLLNQSLSYLKELGIRHFYLEVSIKNDSAISLYEKSGFKKIHEKKHFYSNGESALIMTLEA